MFDENASLFAISYFWPLQAESFSDPSWNFWQFGVVFNTLHGMF